MAGEDSWIGWLTKITETGTRVRLAPGVIGKGSVMWIAVILGWVVIFARLSPDKLVFDALLMLGGMFATFAVMRETQKMREYAKENPSTALLEGAEFLAFKRFEAQAKGLLAGDKSSPAEAPGTQVRAVASPEAREP